MQTRVQHQRLPGDHGAPAEDDQGCVEGGDVVCDVEVLQDEADGVDSDAPGGEEEAPEVEACAALEGEEEEEGELDDIVEGDGEDGGDDVGD